MKKNLLLIIAGYLLFSCGEKENKPLLVTEFNPFFNFNQKDKLSLKMDLTPAFTQGVIIPSKNQDNQQFFKFSFKIKNNSEKPCVYSYKIYYQNEKYKFSETAEGNAYNILSAENFYGSWEDNMGFKTTAIIPADNQFYLITDSFRIVGNPRNEKKYYGKNLSNLASVSNQIEEVKNDIRNDEEWFKTIKMKAQQNNVTVDEQLHKDAVWTVKDNPKLQNMDLLIEQTVLRIKNNTEWFNMIKEKAQQKNIEVNEQLYKDAIWTVNERQKKGELDVNNRWKRNPRVGDYSFLCVVFPMQTLKTLPHYVRKMNVKNEKGYYVNPYYYFLYGDGAENSSIITQLSNKKLTTTVNFNLNAGIYVDELSNNNVNLNNDYYSSSCGNSQELFKTAQIEQYFHNIDKNFLLNNIPIVEDIINNSYTKNDFYKNKKIKNTQRIQIPIQISKSPCETVFYNEDEKTIHIKNNASTLNNLKKENVGINTRIGFTYGKYRAKIKFPEMINDDNIWNGLTYAFWLKFQAKKEWNVRRNCISGFVPKSENKRLDANRVNSNTYSEIDIEIVKTSEYWPKTSYKDTTLYRIDDAANNRNIMVTCTNWDLACKDSKQFILGATKFKKNNQEFWLHRWDDWYKAITLKHSENHDDIFKQDYYWFEIDWQPDKIIWRIGEDKENMHIIGYMDNTVTSIPNNQMLMVITQEYHHSEWWPLAPFKQNDLPFPKTDIIGKIYEIEIE